METPVYPAQNYLSNGHGLKSWLLTKDHKRIAVLYLISISIFFLLGGLFAVGIRLELTTPQGEIRLSGSTACSNLSKTNSPLPYPRSPPHAESRASEAPTRATDRVVQQ